MVCLRYLRDLREIYWGFFCADSLSPLACYSPADYADYAEKECSKLHYFAEKDRLMFVVFWCCLGFICDNLRDLRENRPFTCKGRARNEQGKSKERARNERACFLTALLHKHELHDSTMRQLSFVCEIMQLAAFPLRNQRDLRETLGFLCADRLSTLM